MTTNAKKALAGVLRSSAGTVISAAEAVAALSAEDLLASMTDEQRAGLQAAMTSPSAPGAPAAAASDDGNPDDKKDMCSDCKEPMKDGKCSACTSGASASAGGDAFAAANARALAVMSSEHFAANAALAKTLLANDKLSADEINAALAAAAPATANATDVEAAQRAAMREVLGQGQNSSIDAGNSGASASSDQGKIDSGWKKAAASANALYRL